MLKGDSIVRKTLTLETDALWAQEARRRLQAYREGRMKAIPYEVVMAKYRLKKT